MQSAHPSAPLEKSLKPLPRRTRPQVTFAVLTLAVGAFTLLQSLVIPVMATIQHDLGTTQNGVTWVLTAYLLSASVATPIMGRIGDLVGKERVFVAALAALAVGSLLAALAPNLAVMIVARVIQGIGGGVLPLAFGIIRDEYPAHRVTGAVGTLASLSAIGGGLGLVLAGPIVDLLSYRWLFWIPLIMTGIAAVAAHLLIPASPVRSGGHISWRPALLLSGWLVCLLLALSQASSWGWVSPQVLGLLAAAAALAGLWIRAETRATTPLIDMRMMRRRPVWTANLVALLLGVAMYAVFGFLPQLLQTPVEAGYGFGAGITASGLLLAPQCVVQLPVGILSGNLSARYGGKWFTVAGCAITLLSLLMFAFAHDTRLQIMLGCAVFGLGMGMVFSALSGLIVQGVPQEQTGVASGMNANIRTIGGAIGSAVMASVVTAHQGPAGFPQESGYTFGFALLAGALVLATLAGLLIPDLRPAPPVVTAVTAVTTGDPRTAPGHETRPVPVGGTLVGDEPD
ncbi:MFS transporter [Kineosporia rhizophila]|uniref:MFS transporter n=1 Tax=Kineosporia TaxID=49184 RepID=UPI001E395CCE|nr:MULTISPECIES: MFS transporter [Kineosporia]MCE0540008.1 MFS transporter [Kineosporia rhizophila]GLY14388.1 MFS transporter [Kineosporia sp. NBRC 101677]